LSCEFGNFPAGKFPESCKNFENSDKFAINEIESEEEHSLIVVLIGCDGTVLHSEIL